MRSISRMKAYPEMLTVEDIATIMRVGKRTIYTLMRKGNLRYVKVGKKHISSKIWLSEYLRNAEVG